MDTPTAPTSVLPCPTRACSIVLELADTLRRFADLAAAALAQGPAPGDDEPWLAAAAHVEAGCSALSCCCGLAPHLDLTDRDVFRLAAAAQLLFSTGPLLMQHATTPEVAKHVVARLAAQLVTAASVASNLIVADERPQAAAAIAGSIARPAVLLPWLRCMTAAVNTMLQMQATGELQAAAVLQVGCTGLSQTTTPGGAQLCRCARHKPAAPAASLPGQAQALGGVFFSSITF